MKEYSIGAHHIFVADDIAVLHESSSSPERAREFYNYVLYAFTKRPLVRRLITEWGNTKNFRGVGLLDAHGNPRGESWWYYENETPVEPVQEWVKRNDGDYAALLITSCAPERLTAFSDHSLLLHPSKRPETFRELLFAPKNVRVYVPEVGYVENNATKIHRVMRNLENESTVK